MSSESLRRLFGKVPKGRSRVLVFVVGFMVLAVYAAIPAFAVHDTGFFQLDGDAAVGTTGQGVTNGAEDWDNVCAKHLQNPNVDNQPGEFCHPVGSLPSQTTSLRSTFITDAFDQTGDNIFKGGTDDGSINNPPDGIGGTPWLWKQAKPSPNKADIEQAFAAQYTCDAAHTPPCVGGNGFAGHTYIYFGGTRFANNGDTNIGLWFLHNAVTVAGANTVTNGGVVSCPVTSGCGFSGSHTVGNCSLQAPPCTPGDLFVQSAFTSKPSINVFEWVGKNNATTCVTNACDLQPVKFSPPGVTDNKCDTSSIATIDKGCAIVNDQGAIASPWLFQDKASGAPANVIGTSELFEGGLDLTALGFGDECISTVLLNTRSSGSSIDSTAQDFALGQFGGCTSELHTTAAGVASPGTIGTGSVSSGTDSATLTVNGITNWTGTLKFYLCGPIATGTCDAHGVLVASKTVTNNTSQPIASGDGTTTGFATLTSVGRYCWFGKFTSGTTGVPDASDDGTPVPPATTNAECFTVNPVTPTLTTSASCTSTPCVLGTDTLSDTATLTGTANRPGNNGPGGDTGLYKSINANNGAAADSDISWTLFGPTHGGCTDTKSVSPASITVSGDGTYGPVSYTPVLADGVGVYTFAASYGGDSPNTSAAAPVTCPDPANGTEHITVIGSASSASKQRWLPNDRVVLTTTGGTTLSGTLTVTLYSGTFSGTAGNCTVGTATAVSGQSYTFTPSGDASGTAYNTSNSTFFVGTKADGTSGGAAGDYFWLVHYHDNNLTSPNDRCESSNVSITDG